MPRPLDHLSDLPQPPFGQTAPAAAWTAPNAAPTPAREAPLVLPRDWDLLDLDQRVRTVGEW